MRVSHDHSLYINPPSQRVWAVSTLTEQPLYTHRHTNIHTHTQTPTHTYKHTCHHYWCLDDNDPYYKDFGAPPLRDYGFRFTERSKPRLDFCCEWPGQAEVSLLFQRRGRQELRSARRHWEGCGQATFQVLSQVQRLQELLVMLSVFPPWGDIINLHIFCVIHVLLILLHVFDIWGNFSSTNWSQPEVLP